MSPENLRDRGGAAKIADKVRNQMFNAGLARAGKGLAELKEGIDGLKNPDSQPAPVPQPVSVPAGK